VAALLKNYPQVRHIRVEDGKGKPLGRSFRVKLWPTFVTLKDGRVMSQLVRPEVQQIQEALDAMTSES
jgi:thioredoxin 1